MVHRILGVPYVVVHSQSTEPKHKGVDHANVSCAISRLALGCAHFPGQVRLDGYDNFCGYDGAFDLDVGDFGGGYVGDDDFGDFGGFDNFDL